MTNLCLPVHKLCIHYGSLFQFFGITCGLSAPYVAGQVDYAMHQPNYTTVLVGFNPMALARDTPIEKWHKTCRDVRRC